MRQSTLGRKMPYFRGKVMGGCSAINGMVFVRGHKTNFDSWAAEGNRVTAMRYDGSPITSYAEGMAIHSVFLSPDGRNLALSVIASNGFPDIWVHATAYVADPEDEEVLRVTRESVTSP